MKTLILLLIFLLVLFSYLVYMSVRRKRRANETMEQQTEDLEQIQTDVQPMKEEPKPDTASDECCGQHAVCEKESLLSTKVKPDYYDDEELDLYARRDPSSYSDEEVAEFQNVLYTMKEFDVAGWLKSLQLRQIELPESVKEEALLIVSERRSSR